MVVSVPFVTSLWACFHGCGLQPTVEQDAGVNFFSPFLKTHWRMKKSELVFLDFPDCFAELDCAAVL